MNADNRKKQLFLSTIPKAGTYLIAEFMELLGYSNTGFHIGVDRYLDTKNFDHNINATLPSKTVKLAGFVDILERMQSGQLAFGHLNPLDFPQDIRAKFHFICGYRAPRTTLVSEFIDFRFRRKDVTWINAEAVSDDLQAFETYLKRHGPEHRSIWAGFLAFHGFQQRRSPAVTSTLECVIFYDFDEVLSPEHGPSELMRLAAFLGDELERANAVKLHEKLLLTRTKTSSRDTLFDLPREALWTPAATHLYDLMGFPAVEDYISRQLSPQPQD